MQTLSEQARLNAARAKLAKSRHWATGLLLAACALFAASALYVRQYPMLGFVKAFAEAAMVGALADWFAVTALFRRPLGLPIPHTAILPRNQARIGDELGRFIEHNFLQGKPIALRVYQAQPSDKILTWLAGEDAKAHWLPWLTRQMPKLLSVAKPEQTARFTAILLEERYSGAQIGNALADGLRLLQTHGLHEKAFAATLRQVRRWLKNPETRQMLEQNLREWAAKIENGTPGTWDRLKAAVKSTLVEQVDDWAAEKALNWADGCLAAAEDNDGNALHRQFLQQYDKLTQRLTHSPLWHRRLEALKKQLAQSPALRQRIEELWRSVQDWAKEDAEKNDSAIRAQLEKLLEHMNAQAQEYPQFMRRADIRLSLLVRDFVMRYKDRAAQFVADKVKGWDSRLMVEKLELSVGKDLQYIRINGTLVGGLVGLAIYAASLLLAG